LIINLVLSLLSYDKLSKKPLLFKSFTGLTVVEFDNIYDKEEMTKRYHKHENKRIYQKKIERERATVTQVQDLSNWMLKTGF
jgi:hypothetical protein